MKLNEEKHYIYLLFKCSKGQAQALLQSASENQVLVLGEIALNVLKEDLIKLTPSKKTFLQTLANNRLSDKRRYSQLIEHWQWMWEVVKGIETQLMQVLE